MLWELTIQDRTYSVEVHRTGDGIAMLIDGRRYAATAEVLGGGRGRLVLEGAAYDMRTANDKDSVYIHARGRSVRVDVRSPGEDAGQAGGVGESAICAVMPGLVMSVLTVPGEVVTKGQALMIVESMKMQTEVVAGRSGVVERIVTREGDAFERGAVLICLEPISENHASN